MRMLRLHVVAAYLRYVNHHHGHCNTWRRFWWCFPCDKDYLLRLFLRKLKSLFLSEKPTRNASNPHRVCPCRRRPVPYLHALRSDRVTITTQSTVAWMHARQRRLLVLVTTGDLNMSSSHNDRADRSSRVWRGLCDIRLLRYDTIQ